MSKPSPFLLRFLKTAAAAAMLAVLSIGSHAQTATEAAKAAEASVPVAAAPAAEPATAAQAVPASQAATPEAPPAPVVRGPKVMLKTNMGNILIQLDADKAPKTSANFVRYVKEGFYNGLVFHRVVNDFMIEGGGYDKNLRGRPPHPPIRSESSNGLQNEKYTIAMAREDNKPHSATSQFFINVSDNYPLDYPNGDGWGYCVFGKVIEGMETVDKIKTVKTQFVGLFDAAPVKPVIIESASIVK